jgi:type IX secretion system PorP/SprF family membrane protein
VKKIIIALIVLFQPGMINLSTAQTDPHFSQYYAYPLWLNPALTGVIDGDLRVNANFKNQWANINDGYKTGALSMDLRASDKVGLGLNVINQISPGTGYQYFAVFGSVAYGIPVSNSGVQWLNFGLQAGIIDRGFDEAKLQFGSQYNPAIGFDPALPSNETVMNNYSTDLDISAGIYYHDDDISKSGNVFGGISMAHINTGNVPVRYNIHAGVRLKSGDFFDIIPHAIYIKQQKNSIKAFGISSELMMQNYNSLILGGMYRMGDAAVVSAGYHLNKLLLGVSYDLNTSNLNAATKLQGGIELSLSYVVQKKGYSHKPICPSF